MPVPIEKWESIFFWDYTTGRFSFAWDYGSRTRLEVSRAGFDRTGVPRVVYMTLYSRWMQCI